MEDLENIKLPYILKGKILMSPGVWNNYYYSEDEIRKGWANTDWELKENRDLFLDHEDKKSSEWIGEVKDLMVEGDTLKGDLYIVDKPTAIKLAYGAKMGISPKVAGLSDGAGGSMVDFRFNNFSVVMNPAVKTAYINMSEQESELSAFEQKRKEMGLTPEQFYAIPKEPLSESKLPIYDAAHVRNALARFNQVAGVSEEEKNDAWNKIVNAAKKFGIEVSEKKQEDVSEQKPVEEETKMAEEAKVEVAQEVMAETPKEAEMPVEKPKEVPKEEEKPKEEPKEDKMSDKLDQILVAITKLAESMAKKEEKPCQEEPVVEEKKPVEEEKPKEEMSQTMSEQNQTLDEPDRQTVKGEASAELGVEEDVNKAFLRVLQNNY